MRKVEFLWSQDGRIYPAPQAKMFEPQPVIICFLHPTPVKRMTKSSIMFDSTEDLRKTESDPFERRAAASYRVGSRSNDRNEP